MNQNALALITIGALGVVAAALIAGPLTPPVGAPASTYKTLQEIEPRTAINATNTPGDADSTFRISQPGSYYLTGNVTGVVGKRGIEIDADSVTIDLAGFSLQGVVGSLEAIGVDGPQFIVAVRNGSVGGWGSGGILLAPPSGIRGDAHLVEDVVSTANGGPGIRVGAASVVRNCRANLAVGFLQPGIVAGPTSVVKGPIATGNTGDGFSVDTDSTVSECTASGNGLRGFNASDASTITHCTAAQNLSDGFRLSRGTSVAHCTASQNAMHGFNATAPTGIAHSVARGNELSGFSLFRDSTISHCTASQNTQHGITVMSLSTVVDNTAVGNGLDGVRVADSCLVRGNNVSFNRGAGVGAGIRAIVSNNRIEGNTCVGNDLGIVVEDSVNLIFGNTCRGNTNSNFSMVANNRVGTIVTPPLSGAITGNAGAAGLGPADAWANLAF